MLRLRQVALVVRDLRAAEDEIREAIDAPVCFRDPGVGEFGLHNALFTLGDQFLEVVSPVTEGTTAGRLLDRRGNGGYMAIFQVDRLGPVEERLSDSGVRIVFDARGDGVRGLHVHPKDLGGAIVSIDACDEPSEWPWAGHTWRDDPSTVASGIGGITVSVEDPSAACARWAAALGIDPDPDGRSLTTDDAIVRFRAATGDDRIGITAIELLTSSGSDRPVPTSLLGVDVTTSAPSTDQR
ncbi:MAG: VOC family protein [Ilumatobacter sp.]